MIEFMIAVPNLRSLKSVGTVRSTESTATVADYKRPIRFTAAGRTSYVILAVLLTDFASSQANVLVSVYLPTGNSKKDCESCECLSSLTGRLVYTKV
ncbi:hypothetical protein ACOSQ3_027621 [Xanthoceras sorbifolium]